MLYMTRESEYDREAIEEAFVDNLEGVEQDIFDSGNRVVSSSFVVGEYNFFCRCNTQHRHI